MPVNSYNASLPPAVPWAIKTYFEMLSCLKSTPGIVTITTLTLTSILLLLPLFTFIFYLGVQRWRQQRSAMTTTHSDILTYHAVVAELMSVSGLTLISCVLLSGHPRMMTLTMMGLYLCYINLVGQVFYHLLTCVERYLAVVHPITYLSLRRARGTTIRNISIGCSWLLSLAIAGLMSTDSQQVFLAIVCICVHTCLLTIVSFCSLSVLRVLIRPGPGEVGGNRQRVDQSKLRAFHTIMAILVVILLKFWGNIVSIALYASDHLGNVGQCGVWLSVFWFGLPSSLVLPLLFLQRAGKLACCKNSNGSGQ